MLTAGVYQWTRQMQGIVNEFKLPAKSFFFFLVSVWMLCSNQILNCVLHHSNISSKKQKNFSNMSVLLSYEVLDKSCILHHLQYFLFLLSKIIKNTWEDDAMLWIFLSSAHSFCSKKHILFFSILYFFINPNLRAQNAWFFFFLPANIKSFYHLSACFQCFLIVF